MACSSQGRPSSQSSTGLDWDNSIYGRSAAWCFKARGVERLYGRLQSPAEVRQGSATGRAVLCEQARIHREFVDGDHRSVSCLVFRRAAGKKGDPASPVVGFADDSPALLTTGGRRRTRPLRGLRQLHRTSPPVVPRIKGSEGAFRMHRAFTEAACVSNAQQRAPLPTSHLAFPVASTGRSPLSSRANRPPASTTWLSACPPRSRSRPPGPAATAQTSGITSPWAPVASPDPPVACRVHRLSPRGQLAMSLRPGYTSPEDSLSPLQARVA